MCKGGVELQLHSFLGVLFHPPAAYPLNELRYPLYKKATKAPVWVWTF
jgi:hypothetical protein